METITLSYPSWYLIFSIIGGLLYALFLYYRTSDFEDRNSTIKTIMAVLRFTAIAGIILLLLHPIIKSMTQTIKKPVIVMARDNSSSMVQGFNDSLQFALYKKKYLDLKSKLGERYDIKSYSFGSHSRLDTIFNHVDSETDISAIFADIHDRHNHENIGALVLSSDGLYNRGTNPLYFSSKLPVPIYTIGVGDTTERKDVSIQAIFNNDITYLNDQFSVNVDIAAHFYLNQKIQVEIRELTNNNSIIKAKREVIVTSNDFFKSLEFSIPATKTGPIKYMVTISPLENEYTTKNNSRHFYIDVLDSRNRISIIGSAPHPDIGMIKNVLEQNYNNEISISYFSEEIIDVSNSDLVIFHQLPNGSSKFISLLQTLNKNKTPRWFITGNRFDIAQFNKVQEALQVKSNGVQLNEVTATVFKGFNGFLISDDIKNNLSNFPPLQAMFGEFQTSPAAIDFLFQKIHGVDTKHSLLCFLDKAGIKTAVLAAEGLWKWRLYNNAQYDNSAIVDELVLNIVRFLSIKDDKSRLRIKTKQKRFNENENIVFTAERYNQSLERDNSEDVTLEIQSESNDNYEFTFSKKEDYYHLNAGQFLPGSYNYIAKTILDNKLVTKSGKFSIEEVELESFKHKADFALLSALSAQNGGKLLDWQNMDSISNIIFQNNSIKPISYNHLTTRPLIDFKWPFIILILLLSLEWFMRRYYGKY